MEILEKIFRSIEPIAIIAMGLTVSILVSIIQTYLNRKAKKEGKADSIEERVDKLTSFLKEATSLINNIEDEINARSSLATQLQDDVERYNKLSELKKPEVEAIAQVLRGELAKEGNKFLEGCCN